MGQRGKRSTGDGEAGFEHLGLVAVGAAIASRVALFLVVWLTMRVFDTLPLYPTQLPDSFFPSRLSLDGWARWDGAHYIAIAMHGYGDANPSPHGGLGFFPAYPLLMRGMVAISTANPSPGAYAVAGLVASNVAFLVAVWLLQKLGRETIGAQPTITAVLLMLFMPFSFFFNAVYTESIFLATCLGMFLLARRGRWWGAAGLAGFASGTRLMGVLAGPVLLYMAWRAGVRGVQLAGIGLLSFWGFASWTIYTWVRFGNPFAYFDAQSTWGGWNEHVLFYLDLFFTNPREALLGDPRHLVIALNVVLGAIAIALLPVVWRKVDRAIALFTIALVLVQFSVTWVSLGRYLLPAFGLYLAGGVLLERERMAGRVRDLVLAISAMALVALTILFCHGFWVV